MNKFLHTSHLRFYTRFIFVLTCVVLPHGVHGSVARGHCACLRCFFLEAFQLFQWALCLLVNATFFLEGSYFPVTLAVGKRES